MDKIIVGLYTYSLDSKAAAALLKYYCKEKVILFFCKHGDSLPKNIPDPETNKVKIICLGVNLSLTEYEKEKYDILNIENDGFTSTCLYIYNLSKKENDIINEIKEFNYIWIDLISRFHVRKNCMVSEDAYGFSLYCSMFDTYLSNNKKTYIWDRLINDETYVDYALNESYNLTIYKKDTFTQFNKFIFPLDIKGNSCLFINRRDSDSSVFLEYQGRSKYDFLICFQDSYFNRNIVERDTIINLIKKANTKLVFTIYKNKDKSSIEFTKQFGGRGHHGVSTFSLEHDWSEIEKYLLINENEPKVQIGNLDYTDTVRKLMKTELDRLIKISILNELPFERFIFNSIPIPLITSHSIMPYIRYMYRPDYIKLLLTK